MRATDAQVRKLMEEMSKHGQIGRALMLASMDRKTGSKYVKSGTLPSQMIEERTWRTREDPFAADWSEIVEMLRACPEFEVKPLFEWLLKKRVGVYQEGQLRTFQRHVKQWRCTKEREGKGSSVYYRDIGKDKWMMPLQSIVGQKTRAQAVVDYKGMLYYRGNVPSKTGQKAIPNRIVKAEEARGFKAQGVYSKRLRHFVDGVVIFVRAEIERLREQGRYLRRKHPISQLDGYHMSLREQREPDVAF